MRILIMNILLVCAIATGWTQQQIEDFRGLEWGTQLDAAAFDGDEEAANMMQRATGENSTLYERNNEDLSIGTAILENIFYAFDDEERFYKVILNGESAYNEDMEYILTQRLGKPDKRFRKNTKFVRVWEVGDIDVIFSEQRSKDFVVQIQSEVAMNDYERMNTNINDF